METVRLRKIQERSQLERLLDALASRGGLVPQGSFQIRAPRALSPQLQRVVSRATQAGHVWSCWADTEHAWLFTCQLSESRSRERATPVLEVERFDETGELKETGAWEVDEEGRWRRCVD
jgi:hypothetical protein